MARTTKYEESFIMSVYRMRHKSNDWIVAVPFVAALAFVIFGVPILSTAYDWPLLITILMIIVPPAVTGLILYLRVRIIIKNFMKTRDVSGKTEETQMGLSEAQNAGKMFIFGYSEYMKAVVYNWFDDLGVTGGGKLRMYKITTDNYGPQYLAVDEADLNITGENREQYEKETAMCFCASDLVNGKVVLNDRFVRDLPRTAGKKSE